MLADEARELQRLAALDVDSARDELCALRPQIESARSGVELLYERRRVLFRVLLSGGEKQAVIARLAGVTPMAVAFAVNK